MNYLMKLSFVLALGFFFSQATIAQAADVVTKTKTEEISKQLELTPEQTAKFKTVVTGYTEKQAMVQKSSPNAEEVSAKLEALEASFQEDLAAILTPEQLKKWNAMQPQGE